VKRIVLLQLPPTRSGTAAFTRALHALAKNVEQKLGGSGLTKIDMQRGGVDTTANLSASQIYQIKGVVSIVGPDVVDGAHADLLEALGRAAQVDRHKEVKLTRSGEWTGYLMTWQGRTVLIGRGKRGATVSMRIPAGKGGATTRQVVADPSSGTYVLDLGKLSSVQKQTVQKQLQRAAGTKNTVRTVKSAAPGPSRTASRGASTSGGDQGLWLGVLALLAIVAGLFASRRRFSFPKIGPP
jgi:hypothetical protein